MNRLFIVTISLILGLAGAGDVALAQEKGAPVVLTNAHGNCTVSPGAASPAANGGWTITCGDITPGSGTTVIGPPTVGSIPTSMDVAPAPAPAPVTDITVAETSPPATTETAVATATDQDADNYADAQEPELGLDPSNADTDADHLADGDELNLYSTNPTIADTDGDGVLDGEELFGTHTNPLLWDNAGASGSSETVAVDNAAAPPAGTIEGLTATSGDAAALGTGNASAAPGTVTRDGVSGTSLLGTDGIYSVADSPPPIVTVSSSPAPLAPESAPADVAEATETAEPVAADTDGDSVADDDESAIYSTDPLTWDTDGDGLSDGEELFGSSTDPLVSDTDADGIADGAADPA